VSCNKKLQVKIASEKIGVFNRIRYVSKLTKDPDFNKNQQSIADAPIHSVRSNSKVAKLD
jgi:hypothetical protein